MESRAFHSQSSNHLSKASNASPAPVQTSVKKRRTSTSTSTSRGVANLTPEQLAKKRANDREAQRAIRERTKGQIENLERRIQELTTQKPYEELQHVVREKQLVEAENEDIKRRLKSVLSIIQPLVAANGFGEPVQQPHRDALSQSSVYSPGDTHTQHTRSNAPLASSYSDTPSLRSNASTSSTYGASPQNAHHTPPSISQAAFASQPGGSSPVNAFDRRQPISIHARPSRPFEDKLDLGYLLHGGHNARDGQKPYGADPTKAASSAPSLPLHTLSPLQSARNDRFGNASHACEVPVLNVSPTCPLDGLLLDFLADRRHQALEGVMAQELIGPAYPSFLTLINPQRKHYSHPLSKVFTDMISTFPDISTLPEQVAVLYIMFLIMRWQISPTQDTYDLLPEWVTPRPSQLFTAHPAWIDYLPWPRMRDKMVRIYPSIPFDEFFIPYTTTVSLNWPYDSRDILVLAAAGSDELAISPAFERHLRDLSNWSLGPAFAQAHPQLADTTRIKPEIDSRRLS